MGSHDVKNGHIPHGWFFILIKYALFDRNALLNSSYLEKTQVHQKMAYLDYCVTLPQLTLILSSTL